MKKKRPIRTGNNSWCKEIFPLKWGGLPLCEAIEIFYYTHSSCDLYFRLVNHNIIAWSSLPSFISPWYTAAFSPETATIRTKARLSFEKVMMWYAFNSLERMTLNFIAIGFYTAVLPLVVSFINYTFSLQHKNYSKTLYK